ncbi:Cytochrome P450 family ent-kaurenoic acid oxidase [Melia azedarach]|uniref:Cytochrome P450 family ent-kaurenoic acid oxidase n=1 Tax=Melia azedarach TaxID=155640 RepID=A0ACC1WVU2_MELAZ|nr:Cytochrome P450 family ent-kaurenoic acid oxidase [Melia azedarach]
MELDIFWLILAILVGTCVVALGFIKKITEWHYVRKFGEKRHSLPPGDMGWPFIGNNRSYHQALNADDPDRYMNDLVKRHGRTGIYKAHLLGSPSIIVTTPENFRRVLNDDDTFGVGYPVAMNILAGKRTFLNVQNVAHRRLRNLLLTPTTSHEALAIYLKNIEDLVISSLEDWSSRDKPVELLNELRRFAYRNVFRMALGADSDPIIDKMENLIADFHFGFQCSVVDIPGSGFHKARQAKKKLLNILQTEIDNRRAMKESGRQKPKGGMLDLMMEPQDESGRRLDDEEIIEVLLVLSFAGVSTPAHVSTWSTIFLHRHPEVLQKAKKEQEEIIKRRPSSQKGLSFAEIRQMEYLPKVIDEALRFFNIPFSDLRIAQKDTNINGYFIPKGWKVMLWTRAVHLDPEIYPAPLEYNPSRWDNRVVKPGSFVPFGGRSEEVHWIRYGQD